MAFNLESIRTPGSLVSDALSRAVEVSFQKILIVDILTDTFAVLQVEAGEWADKCRECPGESFSQWMTWLACSSYCHPDDRQSVLDFFELGHLRALLAKNGSRPLTFRYRARNEAADGFGPAEVTLVPNEPHDGHQSVYMTVRRIVLPHIPRFAGAAAAVQQHLANESSRRRTKRTVLVIEDNEINREMLVAILEDDYIVLQAENGLVGMDLLREHYADLSIILLDIQMPVMDGYAFLAEVMLNPILNKVPIIVATGDGPSNEERCLNMGALDFIAKPYNPKVVCRRIRNIITMREAAVSLNAVENDELTGLYTRQAFFLHAETMLHSCVGQHMNLVIADIIDFKRINARFGTQKGDEVLRYIGTRLAQLNTANTVFARYGADQFVVLVIRSNDDTNSFSELINRLNDSLLADAPVSGLKIKYGIYDDVPHDIDISVLCDRAKMALHGIKRSYDVHVAYFDEKFQQKIDEDRRLEENMQQALDDGELTVFYQPKHSAATGELVGAEALARWISPERGVIPPGAFIPLFERNGFISRLDSCIAKHVCRSQARWQAEGLRIVPVSINASRRDLTGDPEHFKAFIEEIMEILRQGGVDRRFIHMEVTESMYTEDQDILSRVRSVQQQGIQIEMDDFGSGYSSLGMLGTMPLDVMKLDMSFVRHLDEQMIIVQTIIELAHKLGMKTVAEGVETAEQLAALKNMGCDTIQGYYFSKPLTEEAFREYLIRFGPQGK